MIYPKTNAKGIDYKINLWISRFDELLNNQSNWGVDIYHKVYREYAGESGGIAPYTFLSVKDYKPVFLNDKVVGEIGFLLGTVRSNVSGSFSVPMDIIFSLNLDKIDDGSTQREDEKAIITAQNIISKYAEVLEVKTTIPEVFRGFNIERIKRKDMQPFLNFSISINLMYKNICNGL